MKLHLSVRHQRRHAEGREIAEDESGFGFVTRNIDIEVHEIALVLVDCWNTGWGPEPRAPEMGWLPEIWGCWEDHRRSKEIINNFIVPARAAAREAGMTVVHAPSPEVARKYALHERYRPKSPMPAPVEADWPPPEWVREMRLHRRWESRGKAWSDAYATWNGPHKDIAPTLKPGEDEFVVATGDELHAICKESRARYLLYAGFALNWCVPASGLRLARDVSALRSVRLSGDHPPGRHRGRRDPLDLPGARDAVRIRAVVRGSVGLHDVHGEFHFVLQCGHG